MRQNQGLKSDIPEVIAKKRPMKTWAHGPVPYSTVTSI